MYPTCRTRQDECSNLIRCFSEGPPQLASTLRMLIKVHDPIMSNGEAVGCCKFPFLEAQAVHVVLSTTMIGTETDGIIVC